MKKRKKITKIYRKILRYEINVRNKKRLLNSDFTIISSNCVGGVLYHELGLRFQSPTINMFMNTKDFIKFCKNISFYTSKELRLKDKEAYTYPVVGIDDITLHCVHYKDFDDVQSHWNERVKRINYDNIFLIMSERDGCTYQDLLEFDNLPFKNKVVFVHEEKPEVKSAYYIPNTELNGIDGHWIKGLTEYKGKFTGKRYIDDFDYVGFFNKKYQIEE